MSKEVPFVLRDSFSGSWEIFCEAVGNPKTIFVYDIDGILIDSPKKVFKDFTQKTGIPADPQEMDRFDYLTYLATLVGLPEEQIRTADRGWYDPAILLASQRYLYIKPIVERTLNLYGASRNFILTSRNPNLREVTLASIKKQFPGFSEENILLTKNNEVNRAEFKAKNLKLLAKQAPWVIFADDSTDFAKAALGNGTKNCVVVNIPVGKILPDFEHERMIHLKRFPTHLQAMYPFMQAIYMASDKP